MATSKVREVHASRLKVVSVTRAGYEMQASVCTKGLNNPYMLGEAAGPKQARPGEALEKTSTAI